MLKQAVISRRANLASSLTVAAEPAHGVPQITGWTQLVANSLVLTPGAADPVGGTTAVQLTDKIDGGVINHGLYFTGTANFTLGESYRYTFWYKGASATAMLMFKADNGGARSFFTPTGGCTADSYGNFAANYSFRQWTEDMGDGWTKVVMETVPTSIGQNVYLAFCKQLGVDYGDFVNTWAYQGSGANTVTIWIPPNFVERIGQGVSAQADARTGLAVASQGTAAQQPLRQTARAAYSGNAIVNDGANRSFAMDGSASQFSGACGPMTMSWLIEPYAVPSIDATVLRLYHATGSGELKLVFKSTNAIVLSRTTDAGVTTTQTIGAKIPMVPHVLTLTLDSAGTATLYVDGVVDAAGAKAMGSGQATFNRMAVLGQYLKAREQAQHFMRRALSVGEVQALSREICRQESFPAGPWEVILLYGQSNAGSYSPVGQGAGKTQDQRVRLHYSSYTTNLNTRGWGPVDFMGGYFLGSESGLAQRAIAAGRKLAIVKCTRNGTPVGQISGQLDWQKVTGNMYATATTHRALALSELNAPYAIRGMVYIGAEQDGIDATAADAVDTKITQMVADLRSDLGVSFPVAWHRVNASLGGAYPHAGTVRSKVTALAAANSIARFALFNGDDLTMGADGVHYQQDAEYTLGQRAWDTLVGLGL